MGIQHGKPITYEQLEERINKLNAVAKAGAKTIDLKEPVKCYYYDEKLPLNPSHLLKVTDAIRLLKIMVTSELGKDEQGQKIASQEEKRPVWIHKDLTLESTLKDTFGLNLLHVFHKEETGSRGFIAANFTCSTTQISKSSLTSATALDDDSRGKDAEEEKERGKEEEEKEKDGETTAVTPGETRDEVIVCFRSSSGVGDWKENFSVSRVPLDDGFAGCCCSRSPMVHMEFLQCYQAVEKELINVLHPIFEKRKAITLKILGHSFGAAVSTLAALSLSKALIYHPSRGKPKVATPESSRLLSETKHDEEGRKNIHETPRSENQDKWKGHSIEHWTVGSPKVGDRLFEELYKKYVSSLNGSRCFRVLCDSDVVPLLPSHSDFVHVGEPVVLHDGDLIFADYTERFTEPLEIVVLPPEVMKDHSLPNYLSKFERIRRQKHESDCARKEGNEFFTSKDYKGAVQVYTRAIEKDGNNFMLRFNRAATYIKTKNFKEALTDAAQAVKLDPKNIEGLKRKALVHLMRFESDKAKGLYAKALELNPRDEGALKGWERAKAEDPQSTRRSAPLVEADPRNTNGSEPSTSLSPTVQLGDRSSESQTMGQYAALPSPKSSTRFAPGGLPTVNENHHLTASPSERKTEESKITTDGRTSEEKAEPSYAQAPEDVEPDDLREVVLYAWHYNPYCQRIEIALLEKAVEYSKVMVRPGKNAPIWFLTINREGKIPILKHNDKILTDPVDILVYIDQTFTSPPQLLPTDEKEREKMIETVKNSSKFLSSFTKFLFSKDTREIFQVKEEFCDFMAKHEKQIALPYWNGSQLSLLDIVYWSIYHRFSALKYYKRFELSKMTYGRIHSWLAKLHARPAFKLTVYETGPFFKALERDARPGPLYFVFLFHNALRTSLDSLSERLHVILGADEHEEIHDIEVSSLVKHFDQMFLVFEEHLRMRDAALFPFIQQAPRGKNLPPKPVVKDHKHVRELTSGIKSALKNFTIARPEHRPASAMTVSESFEKFKLSFSRHLEEDEQGMSPFFNSVSWEEQAVVLRQILEAPETDMHKTLIWTFKHLPERPVRLQFARTLSFSFSGDVFNSIVDWLESEAASEFSTIEKQVRKMQAGRDSESFLPRGGGAGAAPRPLLITRSEVRDKPILTPSQYQPSLSLTVLPTFASSSSTTSPVSTALSSSHAPKPTAKPVTPKRGVDSSVIFFTSTDTTASVASTPVRKSMPPLTTIFASPSPSPIPFSVEPSSPSSPPSSPPPPASPPPPLLEVGSDFDLESPK